MEASMNEIQRLFRAAGYAFEGLVYLLKEQKNTRYLIALAILALIIFPLLGFSVLQTAIIFFSLMMALVAEVINTSIEITLDLYVQGKYHSRVKIAKDVAACSVLFCGINSVILIIIFLTSNLLNH
jgi:diacylglycerol kinase (ATP)